MALRLAVLLSGGGTTLQNIIDHIAAGKLDAEVACVISSRPDAYGIERARNHNIPAFVFARKQYENLESFNNDIWKCIRDHDTDPVVLAGFMSLLQIPSDYHNGIVNIHPALIPAFCGRACTGITYEAVLEYGVKLTGVTVHFADPEYDSGPIICQESVPVRDDDTADTLAKRVLSKEHELYPKAIQLIAEGRVRVEGRRVRILPKS